MRTYLRFYEPSKGSPQFIATVNQGDAFASFSIPVTEETATCLRDYAEEIDKYFAKQTALMELEARFTKGLP